MDDSLEEEWVDQEEQDMSLAPDLDAPQDILISPPHSIHSSHSHEGDDGHRGDGSGSSATAISPRGGGTFQIRNEFQHEPVTPAKQRFVGGAGGKGKNNPFTKSFFSPLALEKMFEPPSPPIQKTKPIRAPSALAQSHLPPEISFHEDFRHDDASRGTEAEEGNSGHTDEIIESDIPNLAKFDGRKPSAKYTFTFQVPVSVSPEQPPPPVDPRLKLFQTYDTYTKDHLSALVDTIDVKSTTGSPSDDGYSRSSKRIKLSPPDTDEDTPQRQSMTSIRSSMSPRPSRPNSRRDYLGESKSLMQQIKNNRSFSIATTITSDVAALSLVDEAEEASEPEGTYINVESDPRINISLYLRNAPTAKCSISYYFQSRI